MKCAALAAASLLLAGTAALAETQIVVEHLDNDTARPQFRFKQVPAPSKTDAATQARFVLVAGARDDNSGGLPKLHDGQLPTEADDPAENFFFNVGTDGGRLLVDLGRLIEVKQVNTYSWHPESRGPQVYRLYVSEGKGADFKAQPRQGTAPDQCGWKLLAKVDTRPRSEDGGGQYGVSISDSQTNLGQFRYLLFDMVQTETNDPFGNTFYSEIDVIDAHAPASPPEVVAPDTTTPAKEVVEAEGGKYQLTLNTSKAPELTEWARKELAPVVREWYPKLVRLIPSEGFEAPQHVSIIFEAGRNGIPAMTSGTRISCNREWFLHNLKGEAKGALIHELVHVIQRYRGGRSDPNATRPPGWLIEGIPDYLRWFKYEPQSHGADLLWLRVQRNLSLKYDGSYRISANFLNWASEKYAPNLVQKVNAALREGKYNQDLWQQLTGHTVQELGEEWKKDTESKLAQPVPAKPAATTSSARPVSSRFTTAALRDGAPYLLNCYKF